MLERLALSLLLLLLGWLVYRSLNTWLLARNARGVLGLPSYKPGRPAILYFTSPDCVPCKTLQRPALESVSEAYQGRLQILEVDCTRRPELAASWGVLSVPTTFIIDAQGRPRGVNHGVTRAARLIDQLRAVGAAPPTESSYARETAGN
jgi:thioredoxin 1